MSPKSSKLVVNPLAPLAFRIEAYQKVWNAAKAELAMRAILKAKGAKGFTTNFDGSASTLSPSVTATLFIWSPKRIISISCESAQPAQTDREFGHICTRMRIRRKVVVGYWKEEDTLHKIAVFQVHEVHVHCIPRNFLVELCVQVQQWFLQLLQTIRMRIRRKVVVGYWKEEDTLHKIAVWMRVCAGWADLPMHLHLHS